jgi:hypothetical protein
MYTPTQVIEALGLGSAVEIEQLAGRQQAYDCVHMGQQDLPIGSLIDLLAREPALKPPRTGHLGNWEDIALGRAGAMDFNQAICARGLGYPLVTCFTQTESDQPGRGDWVYLPGSLVERGKREVLPLFTWDGTRFTRRGRERPLFCPFVLTERDGARQPLVAVHWRRMQAISRFPFTLEAEVIVEHAAEVRPMLSVLLEEAAHHDNPRRAFQDLISHAAATDGTVTRCEMRREGTGYWLNDYYYPSTAELVEHALVAFQAVSDPWSFSECVADLPPLLPVLSHLVVGAFSAIWTTHLPGLAGHQPALTRPFNPHLHWGARDMAGYPPRHNGYFVERSTTRSLRRICRSLVSHFQSVDPVCIVLLPASAFMLCPSTAYPGDAELLEQLFGRVLGPVGSIEDTTRAWLGHARQRLSPYWLNRFKPRRGVLHVGELPAGGEACEPRGFRQLSFRQACAIVGALYAALETESGA